MPGEEAAFRSACSATPPRSFPSSCAAASRRTSSPTRPRRTTRSTATCRPGWTLAEWEERRETRPEGRGRGGEALDGGARPRRCSTSSAQGVPTLDYGNNIRQMAQDEGVERRLRLPGLRAGLHPAAVLPRHRPVPLGARSPATRRTSTAPTRKVKELIPDDPHLHHWLDMARERIAFQGLPARICWLGLGERHRLGLAFNEMVASGRAEGADRHRPRPPRFRLGREPEPRDRGDAGRLRRGLRLAAAQRAAQLRRRARPGCRCTTAAASAWATRSTPAW